MMRAQSTIPAAAFVVVVLTLALAPACGRADKSAEAPAVAEEKNAMGGAGGANAPAAPPPPPPAEAGLLADAAPQAARKASKDEDDGKMANSDRTSGVSVEAPGAAAAAPTLRAWFPETFLFAPRVITGDDGTATVDVLVPDRLTTWRILALAHSRQGGQAGALTTMVSNLPVSIDVVVPAFLMAGDRAQIPIQILNTTDKALSRALATKASGGVWTGAPASVRVDAMGTTTAVARLEVNTPGEVALEASVADDAVRRTIVVHANGKPMGADKSGTLAAKRAFSLALDTTTGAILEGSARASLQVFPGALSILRAELAAAPERSSLEDDAYLVALTGRARALSVKLGAPVDEALLLRLTRLASQRVARYAVAPDLFAAMRIAPGALAHDPTSLLGRNGEHLAAQVARAQRPDGTFAGADGWPVQRLLVATADGLAAVRAADRGAHVKDAPPATSTRGADESARRAAAATLRSRGAFERLAGQINDPYTAAVIVASGALDARSNDKLIAALRKSILDAVVTNEDGSKALLVPPDAVRADGSQPTSVEVTAWAVLALNEDPAATSALPDLGAFVLSSYRPGRGFADGATNRVALEAVALLFATPLPARVVVSLSIDGTSLGTDTLEGARLQQVMTLDAALASAATRDGSLAVIVEADPPLPGLSFALAVSYAVPWPKPDPDAGLSLDIVVPGGLVVGRTLELELRAVAPGGQALTISQGLPAGVDVVRSSLDALVAARSISSYQLDEGVLVLQAPARRQGELFSAKIKIVPSLAGTLHPRVASASLAANPAHIVYVPALPWNVAAR